MHARPHTHTHTHTPLTVGMCILSTGPMLTGEILMGEPRGEGELTRETQAVTHATQAVTHAVTHAVIQAAA